MFARGTIGLMFDNDESGPRLSFEQRVVNDFLRDAKSRGLRIHRVGLTRPDIIAYLHPRAAGLKGTWESGIAQYRSERGRQFKDWLYARHPPRRQHEVTVLVLRRVARPRWEPKSNARGHWPSPARVPGVAVSSDI